MSHLFMSGLALATHHGTPPTAVAAEPKVERITVGYDVSHLLHRDGKTGYDSIDEIVNVIVTTVRPETWLASPDGGNRIFEANGNRLEILASKAAHDEIKERRLPSRSAAGC